MNDYRQWWVSFVSAIAVILALLVPLESISGTQNHKAHVHGLGKLSVAVETDTSAVVDLDIPADSIFGFEHRARTPQDKQAQDAGFQKLRSNVGSIIVFAPSLKCQFRVTKLGIEAEEHDSSVEHEEHKGEHSDINLSYEVRCARAIAGSEIKVGLIGLFPKVKQVLVQVLSQSGQSQKEVKNGQESIEL